MAIKMFAAIDIGSYEVSMKIFELSKKQGIHEVDYLRYRLELGKDAYGSGKLPHRLIEKLCDVIEGFTKTMQEYRITEYKAYATSALRELKNPTIVLERIYCRTGIQVEILSNSEQRFIGYKSIAANEKDFQKMIQKGTAILDVGGGSIQISLFDKDTLVTTQNIKMGNLRIRERLHELEADSTNYHQMVEEFIHNQVVDFKKMYLKDREIKNVILLGDFFTDMIFLKDNQKRTITKEEFMERYEQIVPRTPDALATELGMPIEYASSVVPTIVIYKCFIDAFGAEAMWIPGTVLADGMAYDFGEKNKVITTSHSFENDILVSARNIGKRYSTNKVHIQNVSMIAMKIFDAMKKKTGLTPRERLLLQISILLHDCGKYINLGDAGDCSYSIIMSTEIIGLGHLEREMVANIVKFNSVPFRYYDEMNREIGVSQDQYMTIAKLTAIMRLANALDRSHYQKVQDLRASLRDDELVIVLDADEDMGLELGLVENKADFFEEVFSVRPIIRKKRTIGKR